jgi:hypothetical protein
MNIPSTLTAGDLWEWTDSQADYPAPTWVLSYHFSGPKAFTASGAADGTDHAFSVAATATKDQPHGTYEWLARAVNGTTSTTLARGRVTVEPNFGLAGRSRACPGTNCSRRTTATGSRSLRKWGCILAACSFGRGWREDFAGTARVDSAR